MLWPLKTSKLLRKVPDTRQAGHLWRLFAYSPFPVKAFFLHSSMSVFQLCSAGGLSYGSLKKIKIKTMRIFGHVKQIRWKKQAKHTCKTSCNLSLFTERRKITCYILFVVSEDHARVLVAVSIQTSRWRYFTARVYIHSSRQATALRSDTNLNKWEGKHSESIYFQTGELLYTVKHLTSHHALWHV